MNKKSNDEWCHTEITPEFCVWAFGRDRIEITYQTTKEAIGRLLEFYQEEMKEKLRKTDAPTDGCEGIKENNL